MIFIIMKHIFCLLWTFQIQYFCFQLIVAVEKEEIPRLEGLLERGNQNGVKDLRMLGPKEIKEIEPNCEVNNADSSPTSVEFWGM